VIEQGQPAPEFELPNQDGEIVGLSEFRGAPVVVYFYPKADTSGAKATKAARGRPSWAATLLA
jgi:peroxiredoxin Q/BCP